MSRFVDPYTKQELEQDSDGNLYSEEGGRKTIYLNYDGCYDFADPKTDEPGERRFYDSRYEEADLPGVDLDKIRFAWYDETRPENGALLKSLGDLRGKRVLLLGNGTDTKELHLLELGAEVVYTDISIQAVRHVRQVFSKSDLKEQGHDSIEFHAADAMHLPFPENSFDVIYGFAFVHHVPDFDQFFSEVRRCLKPGGICRFLDGAYSPIWQFTKSTVLRSLQSYTHKKRGISPEDLKATKRGGYREEEVAEWMERFGFKELLFVRVSFFLWLTRRGLGKLFGFKPKVFRRAKPFLLAMKGLDTLGDRTGILRSNLIALVWGFTK
jgi:ubiquinone/menaquinone biosynthesis C-methylase UbiE